MSGIEFTAQDWRRIKQAGRILGGVTGTRVALKNCTIGTLDVTGAKFKDVDLRSSEFRGLDGLSGLAGVVVDDYQLSLLAPLLAGHLGIRVL